MLEITLIGREGKTPTNWIDINGYVTNLAELSFIFGIHHGTLRNRYKSGWHIGAACLVPTPTPYTSITINEQAKVTDFETEFLARLSKHLGSRPVPAAVATVRGKKVKK